MISLLKNRTFILVLAFTLGLIFSEAASRADILTMPALSLVLTVSATQISLKDFLPLAGTLRSVLIAFLLNYLVLGTIILVLAWWLMPTRDLWIGYVLVATAPPGVAVIPFTHILKGNLKISLVGTFGVYLISLLATPALVYLLTGEAAVSPLRLVNTMFIYILIPFVISQFINTGKPYQFISTWRGTIINWGLFVVILSIVGVNQEVFLKQHHVLIPVSIVAIISTFVLALLVELTGRAFNLAEPERKSYILLSTIKNAAFAAAIGLNLYSEAASIPGAVISAWYALYFIILGIIADRKNKEITGSEKTN